MEDYQLFGLRKTWPVVKSFILLCSFENNFILGSKPYILGLFLIFVSPSHRKANEVAKANDGEGN